MTTQSPPATVYNVAAPVAAQPAVMLTHDGNQKPSSKILRQIWNMSIVQIVGGGVLVCCGIVAIVMLGYWSYFSTSIWTGVVIFGLTGIFGLKAGSSGNRCWMATYIAMSITASTTGGAIFVVYVIAAVREGLYVYWNGYYYSACQPGAYGNFVIPCHKSQGWRMAMDAVIAATGFVLLVLGIITACFGCYVGCNCCSACCKSCCKNSCGDACNCCPAPTSQTTAYYNGGNTIIPAQPNVMQQGDVRYTGQQGMVVVQAPAGPPGPPGPYPSHEGALPAQQPGPVEIKTHPPY